MSRLSLYFFKKHIKEQVRQGRDHDDRITDLYREIYQAAKKEFYEDNYPTLGDFLLECFENGFHGPNHPERLKRGWFLNKIGWAESTSKSNSEDAISYLG